MKTVEERARMSELDRKQRIEYLKREIFILDMKEHWDSNDYSYMNELKRELQELEKEDEV